MSRYIDADRLMERYKATCEIVCQYSKKQRDVMCSACGVGSCIEILEDFPTADVAEIKHGRWIRTHNPIGQQITVCSVCGKIMQQAYPNYCGNCGASMDEVEQNG